MAGALSLRSDNALLLSADLSARFTAKKDSQEAQLSVAVTVTSEKYSGKITAPESPRVSKDRPRIFQDMKSLLDIDAKRSSSPSLPKPGDAPRLVVGADGKLTTDRAQSAGGEDSPPPAPKRVPQDEDLPR
tara:strand:- start:146 stop:538 length:393 start_codon:yes stop_codon:yes gene_type:complete